jgi:hypothetical protein
MLHLCPRKSGYDHLNLIRASFRVLRMSYLFVDSFPSTFTVDICIPQILVGRVWNKSEYNTSHSENIQTISFIPGHSWLISSHC